MSAFDSIAASIGVSTRTVEIVLAIVLVTAGTWLARELWWQVRMHFSRPSAEKVKRSARRRARAALNAGNLTVAAERFEFLGDLATARQVHERAARSARQAGDALRTARHLAAIGSFDDAGRTLLRAGDWRGAVEMFDRAGLPADAARALETGLKLVEAAERWEKASRHEDALRCLQRSIGSHAPAEYRGQRPRLLRETARAAAKAGRYSLAAELLEECGDPVEAAAAHVAAGHHAKAASLFEGTGNFGEALKEHAAAGDLSGVQRCQAQLALAGGNAARAAELLEHAGEHAEAALAHEEAGNILAAARCHEQAGDLRRAAGLLRQGRERVTAAGLYQRAGAWREAAEIWREVGESSRALECLGRVGPEDPHFLEARGLTGLVLVTQGRLPEGAERLREALTALDARGQGSSWRGAFARGLAQSCEQQGELDEALIRYREAAALLPDDERVRERIPLVAEELRRRKDSETAPFATGLTLPARYEALHELGRGGMGCVWLARDTLLDRLVALKLLSDDWHDHPDLRRRFVREAKVAARLSHPNVVNVYDAGEHDGHPYISFEYIIGRDAREVLTERGPLPVDEVVGIFTQVARALKAAHAMGIVHRDIKPENLLIANDGATKVADFGIARMEDGEASHGGCTIGTPRYMAPEQVLGHAVDGRADIYALGATAYALLTGRAPFVDGDLAWHQVNTKPEDPRNFRSDVPAPLAELVLQCLAKRRDERVQSADELLSLLGALTPASVR